MDGNMNRSTEGKKERQTNKTKKEERWQKNEAKKQ